MNLQEPAARSTEVLFSTRRHAMDRNPYLRQLQDGLAELDVIVTPWSWRAALFGRYDVVHLHWPEYVVTHRRRMLAALHAVLSGLVIARWKRQHRPVVLTAHNPEPHFPLSRGAARRSRSLDKLVTHEIVLSATSPSTGRPRTVIPHGDYAGWYSALPKSAPVPGRILYFGLIRPYKNVARLVEVFLEAGLRDSELRVVGEPESEALADAIRSAAGSATNVHLSFGFASEATLAAEVTGSSLVVLPYDHLHNSGVALLALSLDRPLLVPSTPSMLELREEVGEAWVQIYDPPLTAPELSRALCDTTDLGPEEHPDLRQRDWSRGAALHKSAYLASMRSQDPTVGLPNDATTASDGSAG